jgi:hypothetical protein
VRGKNISERKSDVEIRVQKEHVQKLGGIKHI